MTSTAPWTAQNKPSLAPNRQTNYKLVWVMLYNTSFQVSTLLLYHNNKFLDSLTSKLHRILFSTNNLFLLDTQENAPLISPNKENYIWDLDRDTSTEITASLRLHLHMFHQHQSIFQFIYFFTKMTRSIYLVFVSFKSFFSKKSFKSVLSKTKKKQDKKVLKVSCRISKCRLYFHSLRFWISIIHVMD